MHGPGMVAVAIVIVGVSSCATRQGRVADCADFAETPSEYHLQIAGRAGRVTQEDRDFVCHAAIAGVAETIFGGMAEQKAENPSVRDFARQMVDEHIQATDRLRTLAMDQAGITPPTTLDAMHGAERERLAALAGAAFDRSYMKGQVEEHRNAVLLFRQQALSGSEPTLQRFAAAALPSLQEHLLQAQRIAAQLGEAPR